MTDSELTASDIAAMPEAERFSLAVDASARAMDALARMQKVIDMQSETIMTMQGCLDKAMTALDTVAAQRDEAKIRIIDHAEPVRISGDLSLADAKRLLSAALPEIKMILNMPDGVFHA